MAWMQQAVLLSSMVRVPSWQMPCDICSTDSPMCSSYKGPEAYNHMCSSCYCYFPESSQGAAWTSKTGAATDDNMLWSTVCVLSVQVKERVDQARARAKSGATTATQRPFEASDQQAEQQKDKAGAHLS